MHKWQMRTISIPTLADFYISNLVLKVQAPVNMEHYNYKRLQ